jgi:UDPglucose 6-dehydrogenase
VKPCLKQERSYRFTDPKVSIDKIKQDLSHLGGFLDNIKSEKSVEHVCQESSAILVLTDWDEFKSINWKSVAVIMKPKGWIFDTRNCINHSAIITLGLMLWVVGK